MWFLEHAWLIPVIPSVGYFVIPPTAHESLQVNLST